MQRKGMQATLLCAFTLVSGSFRRPDPGRQCATRLLAPMRLHWTAARTHTSPSVARSHERAARTSTHARMVMSSNDLQVHAMYRKAYLAGPFPVVCTKRFVGGRAREPERQASGAGRGSKRVGRQARGDGVGGAAPPSRDCDRCGET